MGQTNKSRPIVENQRRRPVSPIDFNRRLTNSSAARAPQPAKLRLARDKQYQNSEDHDLPTDRGLRPGVVRGTLTEIKTPPSTIALGPSLSVDPAPMNINDSVGTVKDERARSSYSLKKMITMLSCRYIHRCEIHRSNKSQITHGAAATN